VKTLLGESLPLDVPDDSSVACVRSAIRGLLGVDREVPVVLYLDSFALDDSWTVDSLNLADDSVVYVRVQRWPVAEPPAADRASASDHEGDIAFVQDFASADRASAVVALERANGNRERAVEILLDSGLQPAPKETDYAGLCREFAGVEPAIVTIVLEHVGGDVAKAREALRQMC
jgi:NACalpha-BTF3-like transcription factor